MTINFQIVNKCLKMSGYAYFLQWRKTIETLQRVGMLMDTLTNHLEFNADKIKTIFHYPKNHSLKVRDIYISFLQKEAVIFYVEGAALTKSVESKVIKPLVSDTVRTPHEEDVATFILEQVLTVSTGEKVNKVENLVNELIRGNTVILIEDEYEGIVVETEDFKVRPVSEATNEIVVKGPMEAFNESASTNRSLVRKRLKDPDLMCEMMTVGKREPQEVTLMYIKDIAADDIVRNVKKRVNEIDIDVVLDLTILEHLFENKPYSLLPATMTTERPDRTASFLREGHVVLLMEGSPLALIVPITFWTLFHTAEDQYLRWVSGNYLRIIRLVGLMITLLAPGLYIAVTTFHPEMLPTDLLLAIAASRERIPFPAIWEILLMEVTFEILREAGIRIPTVIGPTIGIVGAIILGQAAVEANIVSPTLVIVVAITGLASFTIPDIGFNIAVRITRFILLLSANFLGFFGLSLCAVILLVYAASYSSFGVPFFSPLAPIYPSSKDLFTRPPVQKQWIRPLNMRPKDKQRMRKPRKGK